MQSKPKANSTIVTALDVDGNLVFNVLGAGVVKFHPEKANPVCRAKAERHGWFQRIADAAAMSRTDEDGKIIPPAELAKAKFDAISRLITHYETGTAEWSRVAAATGPKGGLLFKALCRMFQAKTADEVRAWMKAKTRDELAALRVEPKVKAIIDAIEAESVNVEGIDTEAMLGELEGEELEEEELEEEVDESETEE